jgi:hypothetical protein
MSGKIWCPVSSSSISVGPNFDPFIPLTRRKKIAAWLPSPDSIVP